MSRRCWGRWPRDGDPEGTVTGVVPRAFAAARSTTPMTGAPPAVHLTGRDITDDGPDRPPRPGHRPRKSIRTELRDSVADGRRSTLPPPFRAGGGRGGTGWTLAVHRWCREDRGTEACGGM